MKRILVLALTLILTLSMVLPVSALAEDYHDYEQDGISLDLKEAGVFAYVPNEWVSDSLGCVDVVLDEEIGYNSGMYVAELDYMAWPYEHTPDATDEEYESKAAPLLTWLCLRNDYDPAAAYNAGVKLESMNYANKLCRVGEDEEYTFYAILGCENMPDGFTDEYIQEYMHFVEMTKDVVFSSYYSVPDMPEDAATDDYDDAVDFATEDLYGNPVNIADVFAEHEITMVNMWATWCPHCIEELPALEEINARLQGIDCGIIGILTDSNEPENVETGIDLLDDAGVTYPVLKAVDVVFDIFECTGLPTSYFVNREGQIVGSPIGGAEVDKYEPAIRDLLDQRAAASASAEDEATISALPDERPELKTGTPEEVSGATGYRVLCVDEAGQPVSGARGQFCTNDICMMGVTDESGAAAFDANPSSNIIVHLLKAPEGYAPDSTEYHAPESYGDVTITLKAA